MATQEQLNEVRRWLEQQGGVLETTQTNVRNEQRRAEEAEERTREVI